MLEIKLSALVVTTVLILILKYLLTIGKFPGLLVLGFTLFLSLASIGIAFSILI